MKNRAIGLNCEIDPDVLAMLRDELDKLSEKWGDGSKANATQVAEEEERFDCVGGSSMAANIWTGAAATVRQARPSKPERETPVHEMNRNDLKNAILETGSKTGFSVEVVDGPRQRRARVIMDASDMGSGMGQGRHF